jgi:hypothetical protein
VVALLVVQLALPRRAMRVARQMETLDALPPVGWGGMRLVSRVGRRLAMPVAQRWVTRVAPHSVTRVERRRERRALRRPDLPAVRLRGRREKRAAVAARLCLREAVGAAARRCRPVATVVARPASFLARGEPMREPRGDLLRELAVGIVRQQAQ